MQVDNGLSIINHHLYAPLHLYVLRPPRLDTPSRPATRQLLATPPRPATPPRLATPPRPVTPPRFALRLASPSRLRCVACFTNDRQVLLLDCIHLMLCDECAHFRVPFDEMDDESCTRCPQYRTAITVPPIRIFIP